MQKMGARSYYSALMIEYLVKRLMFTCEKTEASLSLNVVGRIGGL